MKKLLKSKLCLFTGILTSAILTAAMLTSCIWTPTTDNSYIRSKDTIKALSAVNEPIVFYHPLTQYFKKSGGGSTNEVYGGVLAAFDVENSVVYDYIFLPGDYGECNTLPQKLSPEAGKNSYIVKGSTPIYYISLSDSDTSCKKIAAEHITHIDRWAKTSIYTPRFGIRETVDFKEYFFTSNPATFEIIDSKDNSVKTITFKCFNSLSIDFTADEDGNYWAMKEIYKSETEIPSTLIMLNPETGNITETKVTMNVFVSNDVLDHWYVLFVDDDKIFLSNNIYNDPLTKTRILAYNKKDLTEAPVEISFENVPDNYYCNSIIQLNGNYYCLLSSYTQGDTKLYTINLSTKDMTFANKTIGTPKAGNFLIRDNKLVIADRSATKLELYTVDMTDSSTTAQVTGINLAALF